jgi:hypothetical protein
LVEQVRPERATRLAPHTIFRSNLPLFADRVRSKARGAGALAARSV